jgi:hypothetical protein
MSKLSKEQIAQLRHERLYDDEELLKLCDMAEASIAAPAAVPEGMVLMPKERLQLWHRIAAQVAGHDEWGREMRDEMWAMLSAAPAKEPK